MNQSNKGIKRTLAILIVVCIALWVRVSSLNTENEELRNEISNLSSRITNLNNQIYNADVEDEKKMNVSYSIAEMDWKNEIMKVDFVITPFKISDSTRVIIDNERERHELTRQDDSFVGSVDYPIDEKQYGTVAYICEGDYEEVCEIDWIGATNGIGKNVKCEFEGFSAYGNDKLTLSGSLNYALNINEEIKEMKLIFGEEVMGIEKNDNGSIPINFSEIVGGTDYNDFYHEVNMFYLKIATEAGVIYNIYPNIYASSGYKVNDDHYAGSELQQSGKIIVVLENGKEIEMFLE